MDYLEHYSQAVKQVLRQYIDIPYAYGNIQNEAIFDGENHRYLIMSVGWGIDRRVHGCLLHVDIIEDKVWLQRDGTEEGIADELVLAGIPKENIVLGFHEPDVRQYTGFAVA